MLIDTQANGTAISYNFRNSRALKKRKHPDSFTSVEVPSIPMKNKEGDLHALTIRGDIVTDELCLDPKFENCLSDFDFVYAEGEIVQDEI